METPTTATWQTFLAEEKTQPYFQKALQHVRTAIATGKTVYPQHNDIFNALKHTHFSYVKAVIIGQDPYHGPGHAHGLCFSVQHGVAPPFIKKHL